MNNKRIKWTPFVMFAAFLGLLFVVALGLMLFWSGGNTGVTRGPGMWGMGFIWILPVFGFMIMLLMMLFFFSIMTRRDRAMDGFWNDRMSDTHSLSSSPQMGSQCLVCESPIKQDWNVCPHCGTNLK